MFVCAMCYGCGVLDALLGWLCGAALGRRQHCHRLSQDVVGWQLVGWGCRRAVQ